MLVGNSDETDHVSNLSGDIEEPPVIVEPPVIEEPPVIVEPPVNEEPPTVIGGLPVIEGLADDEQPDRITGSTVGCTPSFSDFDWMSSSDSQLAATEVLSSTPGSSSNLSDDGISVALQPRPGDNPKLPIEISESESELSKALSDTRGRNHSIRHLSPFFI